MTDLELIMKAILNIAELAEYNTTGPDMFYKLYREIERLKEIRTQEEYWKRYPERPAVFEETD